VRTDLAAAEKRAHRRGAARAGARRLGESHSAILA